MNPQDSRSARRGRAVAAPRLLPVAFAAMLAAGTVAAQPAASTLPVVNGGVAPVNATIAAPTGTGTNPILNITQTAPRGAIEWQSFSIGSGATVNITQPSAQSVLVNRVTPTGNHTASEIYGTLNANGRVFVVNTAGVTIGAGAQVNVGSLVASTLDIDPRIVANGYALLLDPATTTIPLVQNGFGTLNIQSGARITADPDGGGSVVLVSNGTLLQGGVVDAIRGRIALGAGSAAQVVLPATTSGFVDLVVTQPASGSAQIAVLSSASLLAESGEVVIGKGADGITRQDRVSLDGTINVGSNTGAAGSVSIDAGSLGSISIQDNALIGAASTGSESTGRGGSVTLSGANITFDERNVVLGSVPSINGTIDTSGTAGGGTITIGGDNTRWVYIGAGNTLYADALGTGDGGSIALRAMYYNAAATSPFARSDYGVTEVYGNLVARGGEISGNGGRIETSGQALTTRLLVNGDLYAGYIDASAVKGTAGTWTIDPFNVTISGTAPTSSFAQWQPTGPGAIVNSADISKALDAGTSVEITTGGAAVGGQAGDITVEDDSPITRSVAGNAVTLTLRADRDIVMLGSEITAVDGAPLNLNLFANASDTGGRVAISGGRFFTSGGNVTIAGGADPTTGFAVGNSLNGGIFLQGTQIDTTSTTTRGDITLRGRGAAGSGEIGVAMDRSGLTGRNIEVLGQSSGGIGTQASLTDFRTDNGLIAIRGSSTRTGDTGTQAVGVSLGVGTIHAGEGSVVIAGRGDDNNAAGASTPAPALGVRFGEFQIVTSGQVAGSIQIAGEAANSTGAGITVFDGGNGGLDIRDAGSTGIPSLSNVSLGAISSDGLALALGFDTGATQVLTTGAVNFRPVSVDANGQVTANDTTRITVGAPVDSPNGFFVDTQNFGTGVRADAGIVIGSSSHTGEIAVASDALSNFTGRSVTLQNTGAGSAGIVLGSGIQVGNLGLLSAGTVTQTDSFSVGGTLVLGGGGAFTLTNAANTVGGPVSLSAPDQVALTVGGPLTIGTGAALATYDTDTGTFTPLQVTASTGTGAVVMQSSGAIAVTHNVALSQDGGELSLVSPTSITVDPAAASLSGGRVQLWSKAISWTAAGRTNYYGCVYPNCTISNVTPAASGLQALFPDRPTLIVTADAVNVAPGQPIPALTYTGSGFLNGDTAATALTGTLTTAATSNSAPGTYTIDQGTLASSTGYLIQYTPAAVTVGDGTVVPPILPPTVRPLATLDMGREMTRTVFLDEQRSDLYGRNLDQPFICTAATVVGENVAREQGSDPLASEWGKVRNSPQLSGCLNVASGGQCAAF